METGRLQDRMVDMIHLVGNLPIAELEKGPYKESEIKTDGKETPEDTSQNKKLQLASTKFAHKLNKERIFRGMLLNSAVTVDAVQKTMELEFKKDDILVCGFPRSGTTWLGEVLYLLISDINLDGLEREMCYDRMLWLGDHRTRKKLNDFPSPRLMKTHLPAPLIHESAFSSRIVLAIRHPKDVAVSYFFLYKVLKGIFKLPSQGKCEDFAEMFMEGYVHWGNWVRHVKPFWKMSQMKKYQYNILPVFYEDHIEDPKKTVRKLANLIEKQVADEDVEQIVETTSFIKMKERRTSNMQDITAYSGPFIRNGKVGDWKNHFSEQQSSKFDKWILSEINDKDDDSLPFHLGY